MMDLALLGFDVSTMSGRLAAASGGVSLILLGRWLLRAQVIASLIRTVGLFAILLGVLAVAGVVDVDVGVLESGVRALVGALPFGA
jgi:hypothetical protein